MNPADREAIRERLRLRRRGLGGRSGVPDWRDLDIDALLAENDELTVRLATASAQRDEWEAKAGMMARLALDEEVAKDKAEAENDELRAAIEQIAWIAKPNPEQDYWYADIWSITQAVLSPKEG